MVYHLVSNKKDKAMHLCSGINFVIASLGSKPFWYDIRAISTRFYTTRIAEGTPPPFVGGHNIRATW